MMDAALDSEVEHFANRWDGPVARLGSVNEQEEVRVDSEDGRSVYVVDIHRTRRRSPSPALVEDLGETGLIPTRAFYKGSRTPSPVRLQRALTLPEKPPSAPYLSAEIRSLSLQPPSPCGSSSSPLRRTNDSSAVPNGTASPGAAHDTASLVYSRKETNRSVPWSAVSGTSRPIAGIDEVDQSPAETDHASQPDHSAAATSHASQRSADPDRSPAATNHADPRSAAPDHSRTKAKRPVPWLPDVSGKHILAGIDELDHSPVATNHAVPRSAAPDHGPAASQPSASPKTKFADPRSAAVRDHDPRPHSFPLAHACRPQSSTLGNKLSRLLSSDSLDGARAQIPWGMDLFSTLDEHGMLRHFARNVLKGGIAEQLRLWEHDEFLIVNDVVLVNKEHDFVVQEVFGRIDIDQSFFMIVRRPLIGCYRPAEVEYEYIHTEAKIHVQEDLGISKMRANVTFSRSNSHPAVYKGYSIIAEPVKAKRLIGCCDTNHYVRVREGKHEVVDRLDSVLLDYEFDIIKYWAQSSEGIPVLMMVLRFANRWPYMYTTVDVHNEVQLEPVECRETVPTKPPNNTAFLAAKEGHVWSFKTLIGNGSYLCGSGGRLAMVSVRQDWTNFYLIDIDDK